MEYYSKLPFVNCMNHTLSKPQHACPYGFVCPAGHPPPASAVYMRCCAPVVLLAALACWELSLRRAFTVRDPFGCHRTRIKPDTAMPFNRTCMHATPNTAPAYIVHVHGEPRASAIEHWLVRTSCCCRWWCRCHMCYYTHMIYVLSCCVESARQHIKSSTTPTTLPHEDLHTWNCVHGWRHLF